MAIWSSRRRLGSKGLRCKIHLRTIGVLCGRPAKRYHQSIKGWADEIMDVGEIQCCKNHAAMLEEQGVILADTRKSDEVAPPISERSAGE